MTISAKIITDSVSPQGIRLTTMQLRYPKFIHGEFMTHRVFSRNASSSRAIPVARMIQDVIDDPAMPVFWGKNQKGMQAQEELEGESLVNVRSEWFGARDIAFETAQAMDLLGAHKQIVNRVLEPYMNINVVCTATEWANFYALRRHEDAQPEMKALADAMWAAQQASEPALLQPGEWHLPYVLPEEIEDGGTIADPTGALRLISTARCARVSYLTHDGRKPDVSADLDLAHRLIGSQPLHASPAEHQAMPAVRASHRNGNLQGWDQFRKTLPGECVEG